MMIQNFSAPSVSRTSKPSAPSVATKAESSNAFSSAAATADSASIDFSASPLSSKALNLLASTSTEATKLEGNIGRHQPGEIIVRTKPGLGLLSGSVADDFGATVLGAFDPPAGLSKSEAGDFLHLKLPAGMTTEEAMAAMSADPRVEFAEPNSIYDFPEGEQTMNLDGTSLAATGETAPNDPSYGKLWGLNNEGQTGGTADADIDAPEAWAVHSGRDQSAGGPILAVLDSGVDITHPDLVGNLWTNPGEIAGDGIDNDGNGVIDDVHGYNAVDNSGNPVDDVGHGTHCAGTIAAQGDNELGVVGVNQNANIMPIKIGGRGGIPADAIIRGVQYATKMGARITSNSWGGTRANAAIEAAFKESPALHIMAAGNSADNNDTRPHYPSSYDLNNNVAVAATDHNDRLASFSCYGATSVDIAAPGVNILSTVPGSYGSKSGTSMATPHVAGAALLVASQYPEASNEELKARLYGGADKIAGLDGKVVTGGRLNINNALTIEV